MRTRRGGKDHRTRLLIHCFKVKKGNAGTNTCPAFIFSVPTGGEKLHCLRSGNRRRR